MKVLLITGPIGAGKSMASRVLGACGMPVFDCDGSARELYRRHPSLLGQMEQALGQPLRVMTDAESGMGAQLDKQKLAKLIFEDREARRKVNALVHPLVVADFRQWCAVQEASWVGIESALFFTPEAGASLSCDAVLYVDAPERTRLMRVIRRDACSRPQALARIRSQQFNPDDPRISCILCNDGDEEDFVSRVRAFYRTLVPEGERAGCQSEIQNTQKQFLL